MSWLNLRVDGGGSDAKRAKALLDALLRNQQEREQMIRAAARQRDRRRLGSVNTEDGSLRRVQFARDEPIGARRSSGATLATARYGSEWDVGCLILPAQAPDPLIFAFSNDSGWPPPNNNPPELGHLIQNFDNGGLAFGKDGVYACDSNTLYRHIAWNDGWLQSNNTAATTGFVVVLPTGGDNAIIVERRYEYGHYTAHQARRYEIDGYENQGPLDSRPDLCAFVAYNQTGTEISYHEVGPYKLKHTEAFIFNSFTARPIPIPGQILDALDQLIPFPVHGVGAGEILEGFNSYTKWQRFTDETTGYSTPVYASTKTPTYTFPIGHQSPELILRALRQSYGIGALATSSHSVPTWYTPAVYSLLRNRANPYGQVGTVDYVNYAQCRIQHLAGGPLPEYFLNVSVPELGLFEFTQTSIEPLNISTPVPGGNLTPSSRHQPLRWNVASFAGGQYLAWDWDQPEYCRQEAMALGFNAQDLQP
jgi:hypothetical protein